MSSSRFGDSAVDVVLNILRRRKWVGIAAFAAAFSLAAPFAVFLPDIYRGTATVIVDSQQAPSTFVRGAVPELETRLVTIQQELLSRARLGVLITRLNLYPRSRGKLPLDAIVDNMRRDIHVDFTGTDQARGNPTTIGLKITYIGLDPRTAAAVPNALASLYVEENTKMRERQTGQLAQFLKSQLDTASQELDRQEARVRAFKRDESDQLPEQMSVNVVTLGELNARLRANADNQGRARDRLDHVVDSGSAAGAPDELTIARNHLRELQAKYTEKHPEVIAAMAQVSDLEQQQSRMTSSSEPVRPTTKADRSAERELARLQSEERTLRSEIATYDQRIHMAPKHGQDLEELESDYKTAKTSYDSIRGRYEEAQLADSLEQTKNGESFRILDTAVVPRFPAAPNRTRLLIMAFVFAIAATVGAMLIVEHLDTSFHSVGELRQFTTVPVLATIPHIKGPTRLMSGILRIAISVVAVIGLCGFFVLAARHVAHENTQLVWMIAGPKS
jgi:succinoglycan biosynthesis transport protein ExoP